MAGQPAENRFEGGRGAWWYALFLCLLVGCGAGQEGAPGPASEPTLPPPAVTQALPTLSPTVQAPSATPALPTPVGEEAPAQGAVVITLDPNSSQKGELTILDAASLTVFYGTIEPGQSQTLPLPPGTYSYRIHEIFEPLDPTACWVSVDEGGFVMGEGGEQAITLFLGRDLACTPTP